MLTVKVSSFLCKQTGALWKASLRMRNKSAIPTHNSPNTLQFLCVWGVGWGERVGVGWGHLFKRKTHWIGSPPCTNIGRECFLKHKCLCVKFTMLSDYAL